MYRDAFPIDTAHVEVSVGGEQSDLADVADVAALSDGRFAVVERLQKLVVVYSSDGQKLFSFGREGQGPGEFLDPVAIEALGDHWLVWDRGTGRFSLFSSQGDHLLTRRVADVGDALNIEHRGPPLGTYAPFRNNVDLASRLGVVTDSLFVHEVQDSGWGVDPSKLEQREMRLLLYDRDLQVVDTMFRTQADPVRMRVGRSRDGSEVGYYFVGAPLFSSRVVWAVGGGSVAVSNRADVVSVFETTGNVRSIIDWPERSNPVTMQDRVNFMEASLTRKYPHMTEHGRRRYGHPAVRQRAARRAAENPANEFAETVPSITALLLKGATLWVSEFSSWDSPEGISLVWTRVSLQTRELASRIRVGERGGRLRAVERCRAYVARLDSDGFHWVFVYRLPACPQL